MTTAPERPRPPEHPQHSRHDEQHRLTAVQGLAALSLDALSSVAYGPEAILVVLVAAGATGLHYALPITGAIIILLVALVVSYRQVIEAFHAVPEFRRPRARRAQATEIWLGILLGAMLAGLGVLITSSTWSRTRRPRCWPSSPRPRSAMTSCSTRCS